MSSGTVVGMGGFLSVGSHRLEKFDQSAFVVVGQIRAEIVALVFDEVGALVGGEKGGNGLQKLGVRFVIGQVARFDRRPGFR